MKKIVAVVSLLLFLAVNINAYADVNTNHWGHKYIKAADDKGYIKVDNDGRYNPERIVSKFESVKVFAKLAGYTEEKGRLAYPKYERIITLYGTVFSKWDKTINNELAFLIDEGIIEEAELSQFVIRNHLGEEVVRSLKKEQATTYLAKIRLAGKDPVVDYSKKFTDDSDIRNDYRKYIYYLQNEGLISGNDKNMFNPKSAVRKVIFATLIAKIDIGTTESNHSVPAEVETEVTSGKYSKNYDNKLLKYENSKGVQLDVISENVKVYLNGSLTNLSEITVGTEFTAKKEKSKIVEILFVNGNKEEVKEQPKEEVNTNELADGTKRVVIRKIVISNDSTVEVEYYSKRYNLDLSRLSFTDIYTLRINEALDIKVSNNKIVEINPNDDEEEEETSSSDYETIEGELYKIYDDGEAIRITTNAGLPSKFYLDDKTKFYSYNNEELDDYKSLIEDTKIRVEFETGSNYKKMAKKIKIIDSDVIQIKGTIDRIYTSSSFIKIETDDEDIKLEVTEDTNLYDQLGDEIENYKNLPKEAEVIATYKIYRDDKILKDLKVTKLDGEEIEGEIYRIYTSSKSIKIKTDDDDTEKIIIDEDTHIFGEDGDEIDDYKDLTLESKVTVIYEENNDEDFIAKEIRVSEEVGKKMEAELYRHYTSTDAIKVKDEDGDYVKVYIDEDTTMYDDDGDEIDDYEDIEEDSELEITYKIKDEMHYAVRIDVIDGKSGKDGNIKGEMYIKYTSSDAIKVRDDDDSYKIYVTRSTDIEDEDGDDIDDYQDIPLNSEVEVEYYEDDGDYYAEKIEVLGGATDSIDGEVNFVYSSSKAMKIKDGSNYVKVYIDSDTEMLDDDGDDIDDYKDFEVGDDVKVEYEEKNDKYYATKIEMD